MSQPNIIFYFSDQQRWDTCGCYGQTLPVTPHLDKLAAEGTLFEHAFTCQPVCGPARACLQTGRYATSSGCVVNGISLPQEGKHLADYFHEAGYETAYVGKWHLASDDGVCDLQRSAIPPERRGGYRDYWMASDVLEFTSHGYDGYVFDGEGKKHEFIGYRADCINNYAIHYLQNRKSDRPFFLFISQIEPHHQNDHNRFEGPDGSRKRFRNYETPGDLKGTEGDWRENYSDYLGQCSSLDANVGRLMDTLVEQGLAENTILIYTSDHGSHFRTRNWEYKRSCHEGCIRVPMIAWGGCFMGKGKIDDIVSLIDLPATLLDCAHIPVPESFDGTSLCRLAQGDRTGRPEEAFLQISESQIGRCIRTARWKYSVCAEGDPWKTGSADVYYEDFLYDLTSDPYEQNNLADDPAFAEVRSRLAARLIERMVAAGEKAPEIRPCSEKPESLQTKEG